MTTPTQATAPSAALPTDRRAPMEHSKRCVYLAHPLSGDVERNRKNAARWAAWAVTHMGVAVEISWVVLTGVLDDHDPAMRALGLRCDCALIERCDEIWLVGSRVSPGMQLEADHARKWGKPVRDFTALALEYEPPAGPVQLPDANTEPFKENA